MIKRLSLLITVFLAAGVCYAQELTEKEEFPLVGVKTNILYDATATFNLGVELRLSDKASLELSGNWNPWTFSDNRKWKHILVQPEFRWWTKETFSGHFFGLHAHYSYYNVGNLPKPPFSQHMKEHRYEGWLAGAGVGYGYRWNVNHKWGVEAEIGVGYAYMDYDKYTCGKCGEKLGSATKHYLGPTKAAVSLVYSFGGKKKAEPAPVYILPDEVKPVEPPGIPHYSVAYIMPDAQAVKTSFEEGSAYLDFELGKADILTSFKNNAAELQKIRTMITELNNDPDVTITHIVITGHASPEGSWASNLSLSERRAHALKGHIQSSYNFSGNLFSVEGRGEDWDTLDSLVARSYMVDKSRVLEIIRSTDDHDGRERRLAAFAGGNPYREMRTNFFPQLRRSDYRLHYTIVPFSTVKSKEVLRTNPSRLSLNEMFLIANTYDAGSDAFNEVFIAALRVYPNDDNTILNVAASALERGDAQSATRYLEEVKTQSSAYYNNRGILHILRGEYDDAAAAFQRALELGNELVTRNIRLLSKYREEVKRYEQTQRTTKSNK